MQMEKDSVNMRQGKSYMIRRNALPPENRLPLHYHDHYEAFYSISGDLVYAIEGRRYRLAAGTLLLIPPYQLHQLLSSGNSGAERISLRFAETLPQSLSTEHCDLTPCFHSCKEKHQNLLSLDEVQQNQFGWILRALLREDAAEAYGREEAERALLTLFFVHVNRAVQSGAQATPIVDSSAQLVQQIVEYLEINFAKPVTLVQLSRKYGVDRCHLAREFSRLVGCPPHRFLLQKRLLNVEKLLRSGTKPQEAAYLSGFSDYSNFFRRFKAAYGVNPRTWQESQEKENMIV